MLKDRDYLILSVIENSRELSTFEIPKDTKEIKHPIKLEFNTIEIPFDNKNDQHKLLNNLIFDDSNTISIDHNKLKFPLTLRKWQKGDFFFPIGLHGKKKVSKFFKDQKLSIFEKENTWLLTSNNEIIWVIGHRLDERYKVSKNTSKILKIKL